MLNRFIRYFIKAVMLLLTRMEAAGLENIPASGGYIIVANHLGRLDIPLVYCLLNRDDILLMVAEKYQKYGIIRWLVKKMNAIWVDRFNADVRAMRVTLDRLKRGSVLVIAPEGTRSHTGALIQARAGASYLAAKSGLQVIPVAVTGTEDSLVKEQWRHLKRPLLRIRVGESFTLPPLDSRGREAALQAATDEIMCRIAVLLPGPYRGVYADHPRLSELLNAWQPPA